MKRIGSTANLEAQSKTKPPPRLIGEYGIPIIGGAFTIGVVLTAATTTYLVAKDALGIAVTALALALYAAGLLGIFAWVMTRYGRGRNGQPRQRGFRAAVIRMSYIKQSPKLEGDPDSRRHSHR